MVLSSAEPEPKVLMRWSAPVTKGVLCVGISPSARLGVCVGMDDNHEVAVIDLARGGVLHKAPGGREVITKVQWASEEEFITVGIRHFKFWTMQKGSLTAKQAK